jgi:hypothetical protein
MVYLDAEEAACLDALKPGEVRYFCAGERGASTPNFIRQLTNSHSLLVFHPRPASSPDVTIPDADALEN